MNTIDGLPVDAEQDDKLKKRRPEDGLYHVVDGEKVPSRKRRSGKKRPLVNPATEQLAAVSHLHGASLNKAISAPLVENTRSWST